jgi:hypothetical protein
MSVRGCLKQLCSWQTPQPSYQCRVSGFAAEAKRLLLAGATQHVVWESILGAALCRECVQQSNRQV